MRGLIALIGVLLLIAGPGPAAADLERTGRGGAPARPLEVGFARVIDGDTLEVWPDGSKLYDSGLTKGFYDTQHVEVSLAGRPELRLMATDGGDGIADDHADWADAKLSCAV
jgi:hypothetical protein